MAADETVYKPGDSDNNILRKILQVLIANGGGGGGGGGGAVTIADGADVALGSTSDAAQVDPNLSDTVVAFLKGTLLELQNGAIFDRVAGIGLINDAAVTNPASSASVIAALKGVLTAVNKIPASPATDRTTAAAPFSVELSDGASFYTGAKDSNITTLNTSVVANQNVGGYTKNIKDTTAVSTSPAYTAGDAVGGKRTLTDALRTSNGSAILESITLLDRANQKAAMELIIFDSDPSAATITDNSAFVYSTDDLKVLARITIAATDYVTLNSKAIAQLRGLGVTLKGANNNTNLYAALVTTGTPTYAATTDVQITFGFLQD